MSTIKLITSEIFLVCLVLLTACSGNGAEEMSCVKETTLLEDGTRIRDVECGDGIVAERGMSATVSYTASVGDEPGTRIFDESGPTGLTFRLGAGQVVQGWDEGLVGMRVGGTRALVVPPELAYGEAGLPPDVPPNAIVSYEVELLDVTDRED